MGFWQDMLYIFDPCSSKPVVIGGHVSQGVTKEDMIFEAKVGLRDAIIRFDPSRGAPLFPLASMYIKKRLYGLVEKQSKPIAAPKGGQLKLMKLKRVQKELWAELGRPPTLELVAAKVLPPLSALPLPLVRVHVLRRVFLSGFRVRTCYLLHSFPCKALCLDLMCYLITYWSCG